VDKRGDFKYEVTALLDQHGIDYGGSLWTDEGRASLEEAEIDEPSRLLLEQWQEANDEFTVKIKRLKGQIEQVAGPQRRWTS